MRPRIKQVFFSFVDDRTKGHESTREQIFLPLKHKAQNRYFRARKILANRRQVTQKNEEKKVNNERKYEKIFPREEEPFDNVSVKVFFVHNVTKDFFFHSYIRGFVFETSITVFVIVTR